MSRAYHPSWCAGDHRCTAGWTPGLGQHRSAPARGRRGRASVVISLVQTATDATPHVELIVSVRLAGRGVRAHMAEAARLAAVVGAALRREIIQ